MRRHPRATNFAFTPPPPCAAIAPSMRRYRRNVRGRFADDVRPPRAIPFAHPRGRHGHDHSSVPTLSHCAPMPARRAVTNPPQKPARYAYTQSNAVRNRVIAPRYAADRRHAEFFGAAPETRIVAIAPAVAAHLLPPVIGARRRHPDSRAITASKSDRAAIPATDMYPPAITDFVSR